MSVRSRYVLDDAVKAVFLQWWHAISSDMAAGQYRADRAALKRAGSLTAVACTPAYQRIYRDMAAAQGDPPWQAFEQDRIAAVIALAAHVKARVPLSLPEAMSLHAEGSDRNRLSALRFTRLLESSDMESLFSGLRRAMPLIGYQVDPASLATDVFAWGDAVKKRWAYAYAWPKKSGS